MKKMLFGVTLFVLVAVASGVMAIRKPTPEPAPETAASATPGKPMMEEREKFSGVIERVDEKRKTIVVKGRMMKEEKTLTFVINEKTRMTKGEATLILGDVKKDMEVSLEYKKEMDKLIAIMIGVSAPKDAPKKM